MPQSSMKRTVPICSPCTSLGDGSDGDPFERGRLVDPGYMSDREYVFEEVSLLVLVDRPT